MDEWMNWIKRRGIMTMMSENIKYRTINISMQQKKNIQNNSIEYIREKVSNI